MLRVGSVFHSYKVKSHKNGFEFQSEKEMENQFHPYSKIDKYGKKIYVKSWNL